MTSPIGPRQGTFTVQPIDQIIFGTPLEEAIVAEADRIGAKRVFVTSTRSLSQLENGPLQKAVKALGDRHVGTYARISAHSPREDVIEETWRIVERLLDAPPPLEIYEPGSWGPEAAETLIRGHGGWSRPGSAIADD